MRKIKRIHQASSPVIRWCPRWVWVISTWTWLMKELCCASSCQQLSSEFQTWIYKPNKLKWSLRAITSLVVGVAVNGVAAPVAYEQTASIDPKWILWILQDSTKEFIVAYPSLRTKIWRAERPWNHETVLRSGSYPSSMREQLWPMSSSRRPTGWDSSGLYAPCPDTPLSPSCFLFFTWRCTKGGTKSLVTKPYWRHEVLWIRVDPITLGEFSREPDFNVGFVGKRGLWL